MSRTRLALAALSALPARSAVAGLSLLAVAAFPAGVAAAAAPAKPRKPEPSVVAPTDRLTPEQERATFALPPGFEAQLVAAEPDIAKPMNLAFDAKGRLWVTDTVEYPFPVPEGQVGRDRIQVLSDLDPATGRARKVSTFATGLNVPLGVLPYGDGAVVYSVPQINRYRDTDGDGKADKVEPMIGPFHTTDTHGMTNNFTRGFDGWVYANHGFRNEDVLVGTDKSSIAMQSGSTYRFKPDGSKLQVFARGQVNPFGLCFDPRGDLYSADCHTRPQYLLLRGAVYPSFGKPDDGLGFGPEMCTHDHGSTAIAGTTYYDADQFPPEYRGNLFNGNPVTNAVDRDTLKWDGSTPTAVEAPDFMTSTDPWFRPVQVTLGPDGALYVADFYNKIIGHYEVDLKHPGRDRTSGRIWRVVYKGPDGQGARAAALAPSPGTPGEGWGGGGRVEMPSITSGVVQTKQVKAPNAHRAPRWVRRLRPTVALAWAFLRSAPSPSPPPGYRGREQGPPVAGIETKSTETFAADGRRPAAASVLPDLTALDAAGLVAKLGDANLAVRLLATNHLADKADPATTGLLEQAVRKPANWEQDVHAMWVLERTGKLSQDLLDLAPKGGNAEVRVHAMRILSERETWAGTDRAAAAAAIADADAAVRRAAADALARHPDASAVKPLLAARASVDAKDTHLLHGIRVSLRDQLAAPGVLAAVIAAGSSPAETEALLDAALGVQSPEAGAFAAKAAAELKLPRELTVRSLQHAVRLAADDAAVGHIAAVASSRFADDLDLQLDLLKSTLAGLAARGGAAPPAVRQWGAAAADKVLGGGPKEDAVSAWTPGAVEGLATSADPWVPQLRKCSDGKQADFYSSLPNGETLTGTIRSKPFAAPAKLTFWLAGHNGRPADGDPVKNIVRLRAVDGDAVIVESPPPRNDVAQKVTWFMEPYAGQQVYIEAVDADVRTAYAWLAFGRLGPAVVPIPPSATDLRKRTESAADLAGALGLTEQAPAVLRLLAAPGAGPNVRVAAAKAAALLAPAGSVEPLVKALTDRATPPAVKAAAAAALGTVRDPAAGPAMVAALAAAPEPIQRSLATALSGTRDGGEALLSAVAAGKASPRLLTDKPLRDRLRAANVEKLDERLAALTKGLPDADAAVQKLIDERVKFVLAAPAKAGPKDGPNGVKAVDRGKLVFAKNCAACHRVANEGAQVGPQLDGVGKRGVERTVEDVLDPSRNVDGAFRLSVLTLDDGDVVTGLQRRAEGESFVFADTTGKEFTVPKARIKKRVESQLSLMPSNFGEVLSAEEMSDLVAYLMAH